MSLYELAMQIVPVMVIALFLDHREDAPRLTGFRGWWYRVERTWISVLSAAAFFVSMFVVSGTIQPGRLTEAIVISALSGTLMLLYAQSAHRSHRRRDAADAANARHASPVSAPGAEGSSSSS